MSGKRSQFLQVLRNAYPEKTKDELIALIVCKNVRVNGEVVSDPKALVANDAALSFGDTEMYVSRGGYKLAHALTNWDISVDNLTMLDAGSSTGGFTDCLLQHGASLVHSVDVGYNQLDYRLRVDSRVVVHERQNIMRLKTLEPSADAAVADLSFRSIKGAASHILSLTSLKWMIALIKPQFEVPKGVLSFDGVVNNRELLVSVMNDVYHELEQEGIGVQKLIASPITGRKGNTEYLALLRPGKWMEPGDFFSLV